jgi:integrase
MARKATGQILQRKTKRGRVFGLRFPAYGERQYVTLGGAWDGWTQARAEEELANILADVRRGIWRPPAPEVEPSDPAPEPTFHEFASAWLADVRGQLRPKTTAAYEWQLTHHLLPFFAHHRLAQITIEEVDGYRTAKVREGQLSYESINKTITRLAQILELAVEYGYLDRNPARGKRRRLKAPKPPPVWLDRAEHIAALLDAAGELDRVARPDRRHIGRRAIVATLVFTGLRIEELVRLRWRDVDLAGSRITVRESKTDAGAGRTIDLLPVLRDELAAYKATQHAAGRAGPERPAFPAATGTPLGADNIRHRVFTPAVELANERLAAAGDVPLPERLSPHKLRHTFTSLLIALGVDPGAVQDQLGHESAAFTFKVYRHSMRRTPDAKAALYALVGAAPQPPIGTGPPNLGTGAYSIAPAVPDSAHH